MQLIARNHIAEQRIANCMMNNDKVRAVYLAEMK